MRGRAVFGRGSGGTTPAGAGDGGRGAAAAGTAGTAGTAGGARPHTCQLTGSSERETGIKYRHRRFQAGARWEYQPKGRAQGLPGETARARRGDGCASAEPRPHGPDARPPAGRLARGEQAAGSCLSLVAALPPDFVPTRHRAAEALLAQAVSSVRGRRAAPHLRPRRAVPAPGIREPRRRGRDIARLARAASALGRRKRKSSGGRALVERPG